MDIWIAALLIVASAGTSFLSAAAGVGGGLAMLAILGAALPAAAVIPVHGAVQLGANAGRAWALRRDLSAGFLGPFAAGALAGAAAGGAVAVSLPPWALRLALAAFILALVWGPRPRTPARGRATAAIGGAVTTALSMVLGATGPLVGALAAGAGFGRRGVVGTMAAAMTVQHGLKTGAFAGLGFAFLPWAPLIAAMVAAGVVGTWLGVRALGRLPEAWFRPAFRWLLTALALNLAAQAVL